MATGGDELWEALEVDEGSAGATGPVLRGPRDHRDPGPQRIGVVGVAVVVVHVQCHVAGASFDRDMIVAGAGEPGDPRVGALVRQLGVVGSQPLLDRRSLAKSVRDLS